MSSDATADCSSPLREFDVEVRLNQQRLVSNLQPSYDFVVCGAGSSGSVVARRLAENADAKMTPPPTKLFPALEGIPPSDTKPSSPIARANGIPPSVIKP